ncbi:MAG TPA: PQQ-binding-like beta-propeller repeat protein [Trebonia sp.]|nr:PQQ-binding-like beta-propeller repeat protein [Trebonia sp.]
MDRRQFLTRSAATTAGAVVLATGKTAQAAADGAGARAAAPATASPPGLARPVPPQPKSMGLAGRDFPKVGGDLGNKNYSTLSQINRANVRRLGGAWRTHLEGGSTAQYQECTVVAQDGVLYVQTTQQNVFAVNGKTGEIIWKTAVGSPQATTDMRGVGLGQGLVFSTSGANIAYALDARTGAVVWQTPLLNEPQHGLQPGVLAAACTYFDGLVYIGMNGSVVGARGHAYALDAATGAIVWTFWSCPGPGEYGNDTWAGTSWQSGGAVPWVHPAIDPDLGLVYWTFGNPYPRTDGSTREGANLFANSLVALDAKTGSRRWHFQSVHHDLWDCDNVMAPVLADLRIEDEVRKVVVYGSKAGMFYILDRVTGEPVHGVEERPVPQDSRQLTWPTQPFPGGEPFVPEQFPSDGDATRPVPFYPKGPIFTPAWDRPTIIFPGAVGGGNWAYDSFSLDTGYVYVGYSLIDTAFSNARGGLASTPRPYGEYMAGGLAAVDPRTNTVVWRKPSKWWLSLGTGVLTTAGRLIFQGRPDGTLAAMDDATGEELWTWQCGAGANTCPISYEIDGEQYIAILAGGEWEPVGPATPYGDSLWAFKLDGSVPQAAAPAPPPTRNPITATPVTGAAAGNTVTLGRIWDAAAGAPGSTENTVAQNAMAPQALVIPAGTTVTFTNPAGNSFSHGAASFFDHEFDSGVLAPGQSFSHTFRTPREYYYNDPVFPQSTGLIIVQ